MVCDMGGLRKWLMAGVLFCLFWGAAGVGVVKAAKFEMAPAVGSYAVGKTWSVKVNLDTGGKKVWGADAYLTFDPKLVQVVSAEKGDFFGVNFTRTIDNEVGTLYVADFFDSDLDAKTGTGTLANLVLSAKGAGLAAVAFECDVSRTDASTIYDTSDKNIVDCTAVVDGEYTLTGGGVTVTITPTGSLTGTVTPTRGLGTPTPEPPDSGWWEVTAAGVVIGVILMGLGMAILL